MKYLLGCILSFLSLMGYSQDIKMKDIATNACSCISKLKPESMAKMSEDNKNLALQDCIKKAIKSHKTADQLNELFNGNSAKEKKITETPKTYKEVEILLLKNCPSAKSLYVVQKNISLEAIDFYQKAQNAVKNKDPKSAADFYQKAILGFEKAKVENGVDVTALYNVASSYEYLSNYDKSIYYLTKLHNLYPDEADASLQLGRMYQNKKDIEKALDNTLQAFNVYNNVKSPKVIDAKAMINVLYNEFSAKNKLDVFSALTKKYNINIMGARTQSSTKNSKKTKK